MNVLCLAQKSVVKAYQEKHATALQIHQIADRKAALAKASPKTYYVLVPLPGSLISYAIALWLRPIAVCGNEQRFCGMQFQS